jgi:hypothetical protein
MIGISVSLFVLQSISMLVNQVALGSLYVQTWLTTIKLVSSAIDMRFALLTVERVRVSQWRIANTRSMFNDISFLNRDRFLKLTQYLSGRHGYLIFMLDTISILVT